MNCNPGTMARIVKPHLRHGTIVEVLCDWTQADRDELIAHDVAWAMCGHVWLCKLLTGAKAIRFGAGKAAYLYPGDEAWIADRYLRPISDPDECAWNESIETIAAPERGVGA